MCKLLRRRKVIEVLDGFPATVLSFACTDEVTKSDYETVPIPAVEQTLKDHAKVRLYYRIGPDMSGIRAGAVWDDFKIGMEHLGRWERAALVTDSDSMKFSVKAFGFLIPGGIGVFPLNAEDKALEWIQEDL